MNRSKIEWCDHTWNPITGCLHNCEYCYARKITTRFSGDVRLNKMCTASYTTQVGDYKGQKLYVLDAPMANETGYTLVYPFGFEPTFHRYRLDIPSKLKMGNNIFVGAMADIFGEWVPDEWLDDVFSACEQYPIHNYLFLTKNPQRFERYDVPRGDHMWYGTTITRENETGRVMYLPAERRKFVSIEPLMEDIEPDNNYPIFRCTDWVIIGAETGRRKGRTVPQSEWVKKIVAEADKNGIPVFMKDSLIPVVGESGMRRNFPEQLRHQEISPKMKKKLFGECAGCKANFRKNGMLAILARSKRGEQPKQFAFLCKDCFKAQCEKWGIEIPLLGDVEKKI